MAKQNLGMVTAYAYAVVGGYEGTEAEFEALLGNIATDLAEIENLTVIANTLPPGSPATASYDHGVLTLGIPKGDKGDTGAGATVTAGTTTTGNPGTNASVTNIGTTKDAVFNFTIPRGDTGNGIESIYLTGTSGAVKTYTILFTDGTTTTFDVTDGEVTNAQLTAVVTDLKEDINMLVEGVDFKYNLEFTDNTWLNSGTGNTGYSTNFAATLDFYPVSEGQTININLYGYGSNEAAVCFYSDEAVASFISSEYSQGFKTIIVPANAKYARFATYKANVSIADAFAVNYIVPVEYGYLSEVGATISDIKTIVTDIPFDYSLEWTNGYYIRASNGTLASNANFQYTEGYYLVEPGQSLQISLYAAGSGDCAVAFYDKYKRFVSSVYNTVKSVITVPNGISYARFCNQIDRVTDPYVKNYVDVDENPLITISGNVLDKANITHGYTLLASGALSPNATNGTTDFIPVQEGDEVVVTVFTNSTLQISRIVTYDEDKTVISGTTTDVNSFTVPSGVSYVRFSTSDEYLSSDFARVNLKGVREKFEPYYIGETKDVAQKNGTNINLIKSYPLTTLPDYICNNMAYKPLGPLSKGYISIQSDDGNSEDETYTIPMFISKNVPCTLAMFSTSQVLQTASGLAAVKDAIENHGFCVSQHGGSYWQNLDEYQLNSFFDAEKEYWDSVEIPVYGAVNPGTDTVPWVKAVAGGRFGSFRADYYAGSPYYDSYINGPRSNLYGLTSSGIPDYNITHWQDVCDKAKNNKWLLMIHFHSGSLTATHKTVLEAVIDYAKSIDLEFITMKEVPDLL